MTVPARGKTWVADQIGPRVQPPVTLMAIGTGTPSATALGAEINGSRHVVTPVSSNAIATYKAHWDIDDQFVANITEAGIFANDGTMIASQSFPAVTKTIDDAFNVTWNIGF